MSSVELTDSGFHKMKIRGFSREDLPKTGLLESKDESGNPIIFYITFDGIRRKDGKRRFGFVEGDFKI